MTMSRERPHRGNWTCMVFETATSLAKLGFILTVFLQGVILGQHLRNTARSARGANRSTSKLWLQTFPWEKRLIPNRIAWHTLWMQGSIFIAAIPNFKTLEGSCSIEVLYSLAFKTTTWAEVKKSRVVFPDLQQFSARLASGNSHQYLIWLWWRASLAWPSPNARSHHKDRFVGRMDIPSKDHQRSQDFLRFWWRWLSDEWKSHVGSSNISWSPFQTHTSWLYIVYIRLDTWFKSVHTYIYICNVCNIYVMYSMYCNVMKCNEI